MFQSAPQAAERQELRRGRSAALVERRNEKIAYRYYYKAYILGMRSWEEIIEHLGEEFDLGRATVVNIITQQIQPLIRRLMCAKPDVKELRKLYPYMVWRD